MIERIQSNMLEEETVKLAALIYVNEVRNTSYTPSKIARRAMEAASIFYEEVGAMQRRIVEGDNNLADLPDNGGV